MEKAIGKITGQAGQDTGFKAKYELDGL
jgi:hypothetical protein